MEKFNFFKGFKVNGLDTINGGRMLTLALGTCKLTKCDPCPDQPCADCCKDEEDDD